MHYTTSCKQSSAPEDGRYYGQKHVELIGIINKPLVLNLVGCLYYCSMRNFDLDDSGLVNMKMNLGVPLVEHNFPKSLESFEMAAPCS